MKKLMEQISLMELINGLITEGKEVKSSSNQGNKNNNNNNKNNYKNNNNILSFFLININKFNNQII